MDDERHLHVLGDGHRAEGGGDLKGAGDAAAANFPRRQAGDVAAIEPDRAAVGGQAGR